MTDSADLSPTSLSNEMATRLAVVRQAGAPELYANTFAVGLGLGDVTTILEQNGNPVAVLNLSFTVAKTLSRALAEAVGGLEGVSKRDILTTHEIEAMFREAAPLK